MKMLCYRIGIAAIAIFMLFICTFGYKLFDTLHFANLCGKEQWGKAVALFFYIIDIASGF